MYMDSFCFQITEDMEDEPSEYASAGTAAHELAEYKGKKILGLEVELYRNTQDEFVPMARKWHRKGSRIVQQHIKSLWHGSDGTTHACVPQGGWLCKAQDGLIPPQ